MKTIIELAQECGYWSGQTVEMNAVGLERFADLIRADEREACAKVCEEQEELRGHTPFDCAAAIRARGQDPMPLFDD